MAPSHRCIGLLTIMSMIACVISCANDTKRRARHKAVFSRERLRGTRRAAPLVAGAKGPDVCLTMKPVGKPDAGNPHVRFDERGGETERCRMAQATAPVLDSTVTCRSETSRRAISAAKVDLGRILGGNNPPPHASRCRSGPPP